MCGIAGFTTLRRKVESPESVVRKMADALRPRGPDGDGYYFDEYVALGHRRLSIIDVAGGAQPIATADGRYQFIYNGELYNYVELRADLEARGVQFKTHSDTEVLLYALAEFGVAGLQRCAGMFAFAPLCAEVDVSITTFVPLAYTCELAVLNVTCPMF